MDEDGAKSTFCRQCGDEIGWGDRFCRHCGAAQRHAMPPDEAHLYESRPRKVQTVEQTGKGWKFLMLVCGAMVVFGGIGACVASVKGGKPASSGLLFLIAGVGFVGWLLCQIGAWWDHG